MQKDCKEKTKYEKVKAIFAKKLKACEIRGKEAKINKLKVKEGEIDTLNTTTLMIGENNVGEALTQRKKTISYNRFDCAKECEDYPSFLDRCPEKPEFVSDELWKALLDSLKAQQDQLVTNFAAGRDTLGLPQCTVGEGDPCVHLVGTKSLPLSIETNDPGKPFSYRRAVGWTLHVVNQFYRDFINPETATFSAKIIVPGSSGIEGVIEVTAVSQGKIEEGSVLKGSGIPWGTTIFDQLTGTPGGVGTYKLSIAYPVVVGPEVEMQSSKFGPKIVSVFTQVGTLRGDPENPGAIVLPIEIGNRQFEPSIDWSLDDPTGTTHTGEIWTGSTSIPTSLLNNMIVENSNVVPVVQMAIFAESGTEVYYSAPDCGPTLSRDTTRQTDNDNWFDKDWDDDVTFEFADQEEPFKIQIVSARNIQIPFVGRAHEYTLANPVTFSDLPNSINISGTVGSSGQSRFNLADIRKSVTPIEGELVYNFPGNLNPNSTASSNIILVFPGPLTNRTATGGEITRAA